MRQRAEQAWTIDKLEQLVKKITTEKIQKKSTPHDDKQYDEDYSIIYFPGKKTAALELTISKWHFTVTSVSHARVEKTTGYNAKVTLIEYSGKKVIRESERFKQYFEENSENAARLKKIYDCIEQKYQDDVAAIEKEVMDA
jgi:hypothetical protein